MGRWQLGLAALLALLGACDKSTKGRVLEDAGVDSGTPMPTLSRAALLDPQTCKSCHPRHYREWASSMHAYASKDPVFLAMNERGQRETNGELGDFCISCHAPMAVREGKTEDGLNIAQVDESLQGVTCYFCHNATGIEEPHNGKLTLANDTTMRGSIKNPVNPGVHGVAYSEAHDRNSLKSSELCGACHDVVTPKGVHIERTYAEYLETPVSKPENKAGFDTCQGCHMDPSREDMPAASVPGMELPARTLHEHLWPGVDVALTEDFPDQEAQRLAVECALAFGTGLFEFVANDIGNEFTVRYETDAAHAQPSGAAQDRRLWIEFIGYDEADNVIFQSGNIADDALEELPKDDPLHDPYLFVYRDRIFDAAGKEAHMFWDAEPSELYPLGYDVQTMPYAVGSALMPHYIERKYVLEVLPARVEARMRIRPIGMDILHDLVESGDLDEEVLAKMPTFTLYGTEVEWTKADGADPIMVAKRPPLRCPDDYRELLDK